MVRVNSKKFFYEAIAGSNPSNIPLFDNLPSSIPNKDLLKNPRLVGIVIDVLAYSVPAPKSTLNTPDKLKDYYDSQAELLIERKHRIPTNYLKLQEEAYEEILEIVRGKTVLTSGELSIVKFLEQEAIEIGLHRLLRDYSEDEESIKEHIKNKSLEDTEKTSHIITLNWLRKKTPKSMFNTACYHCGKVLKRYNDAKKNSHFCNKRENLKCFLDTKRRAKQEQIEWNFIMGDQKCAYCKRPLTVYVDPALNNFHNSLFFCPENKYSKKRKNCYEAYRKKHQRDTSKNTYIEP